MTKSGFVPLKIPPVCFLYYNTVSRCRHLEIALTVLKNADKIAEYTDFKGQILWGAIPAAFGDDLVVGNNEKLKSIGWEPKYSLEDGLKQTINWWRNNNV